MSAGKSAVLVVAIILTLLFVGMLITSFAFTGMKHFTPMGRISTGMYSVIFTNRGKGKLTGEQSCWIATSVFLVLMASFWAIYDNVEW